MANNHGQKQIFYVRDTTYTYLVSIARKLKVSPVSKHDAM
jgi:hypothetical protein